MKDVNLSLLARINIRGRIQRKTCCMGPYAGVDYNLTLCRLQNRVEHMDHGQPDARVDLIPMPESSLSPSQDLRIWPLQLRTESGHTRNQRKKVEVVAFLSSETLNIWNKTRFEMRTCTYNRSVNKLFNIYYFRRASDYHRRSSLFENLFMGTIHISCLSSNLLLIIIKDVVSKKTFCLELGK